MLRKVLKGQYVLFWPEKNLLGEQTRCCALYVDRFVLCTFHWKIDSLKRYSTSLFRQFFDFYFVFFFENLTVKGTVCCKICLNGQYVCLRQFRSVFRIFFENLRNSVLRKVLEGQYILIWPKVHPFDSYFVFFSFKNWQFKKRQYAAIKFKGTVHPFFDSFDLFRSFLWSFKRQHNLFDLERVGCESK
jgi:hypothetical protein